MFSPNLISPPAIVTLEFVNVPEMLFVPFEIFVVLEVIVPVKLFEPPEISVFEDTVPEKVLFPFATLNVPVLMSP